MAVVAVDVVSRGGVATVVVVPIGGPFVVVEVVLVNTNDATSIARIARRVAKMPHFIIFDIFDEPKKKLLSLWENQFFEEKKFNSEMHISSIPVSDFSGFTYWKLPGNSCTKVAPSSLEVTKQVLLLLSLKDPIVGVDFPIGATDMLNGLFCQFNWFSYSIYS